MSNPAVEMEELEPVDRSPVENTTAAIPSVMFVSGFDDEDDNAVQHRAAEAGDDDDDDVAEDVPLVAASVRTPVLLCCVFRLGFSRQ